MAGLHPPLRPYARLDVLAPTGTEAEALDSTAIETHGVPQPVLMENAGRAAAMIVQRLRPHGRVVGVVGSGNNGGDALVLLRALRAWGREVLALVVADRPLEDPLLYGWDFPVRTDEGLDSEGWRDLLGEASVVVDGVLGTGLRGSPRERQRAAIEHINALGRWVLSIDVPSGIDSAIGGVPGSAVRATVTVAFGAPKLGSLLHSGAFTCRSVDCGRDRLSTVERSGRDRSSGHAFLGPSPSPAPGSGHTQERRGSCARCRGAAGHGRRRHSCSARVAEHGGGPREDLLRTGEPRDRAERRTGGDLRRSR